MTNDTPAILDASQKQDVSYCIPLWLRDEQIMQAIARIPGRIQPRGRTDDRVAVVGYGPSLRKTWEQLKDFKHIITCSGSHRFLLERGIVPEYHVEVDPRPHKIQLIGQPHPATTYLIASTCSPKLFDHLDGFNVQLWHVFDSKEEGIRILPRGEWALTGGCDVGSRAITIAGFLGFRDVHVFGMDGCESVDGSSGKHAAEHPNEAKKYSLVEYSGVQYRTTQGLLEAARQLWHELDQMPAVHCTFYGEGLVQAMARDYRPKGKADVGERKPFEDVVGFLKPILITDEYARLNEQLHRDNLAYGVGGGRHAAAILELHKLLSKPGRAASVLDYGCGKGYLAKALGFPIWEYDPAVEGKKEAPRPADIVACTDVLEHVEPELINYVLEDLRRLTKQLGYFVIHTGPSSKKLADGRNAHVLQRDRKWWKEKLKKYFSIGKIEQAGPLLLVLVGVKAKKKPAQLAPQPKEPVAV
jgi:hypothetical protein